MFESYYGWQPDESDTETINIDLADDDRDSLHESEGDKPGSEVDIEQDNGYDTDLDIDDHGEHLKATFIMHISGLIVGKSLVVLDAGADIHRYH